jgi:hypothetical protein
MSVSGWPWMLVWVIAMWFVVRPLGRYLARRMEAKAPISPVEKERLMRAFDTLGRERVALGLTATGHGWGDCFLSHATAGQPFGLRPALVKGWRTNGAPGLNADMTKAVVRVWDRKETAFRALAAQWLERQPGQREGRPAPLTVASESLHATRPALDRREAARTMNAR